MWETQEVGCWLLAVGSCQFTVSSLKISLHKKLGIGYWRIRY